MSAQNTATQNAATPAPAETPAAEAAVAAEAQSQATAQTATPEIPQRVIDALKMLPENVLKRISDKGDYDKSLISEFDRQIGEHRKKLDQFRQQSQQVAPPPPQMQPTAAAQPQRFLDIDGKQWLQQVDANPNEGLDSLASKVVEKAISLMETRLPQVMEKQSREKNFTNEVREIHQRLLGKSPELAQRFMDIGNDYANQGMVVPPAVVENEALFGPHSVQQQLMALGLKTVLAQREAAQAQQPAQPIPPPNPFAPGVSNQPSQGVTAQNAPRSLNGTWKQFFGK